MKKLFTILVAGLLCGFSAGAFPLTGMVVDQHGEPIIGASVAVKGTTIGVSTDHLGEFTLNVPSEDSTVVISFIGYRTLELPANSPLFAAPIVLEEEQVAIENVVVIGYGQIRRGDATGSLIAVTADDLAGNLGVSPETLLQGKVAGLSVTTAGGAPGSSSTIRFRGGSSLSASNDPLIIVDGVPLDNQAVNGMSNGLSTINPNDIESVTVLKDASATAIYGSRASNGVILITTKRGRAGKVSVNYNGTAAISTVPKYIDVMSASQFREFIRNNFGAGSTAESLLGNVDTDWQKAIFRTSFSHDHNVSVSGSTPTMPYRASFGYNNDEGILKTSRFQRFTLTGKVNPKFFDNHLSVDANIKGIVTRNRFADVGAIGGALMMDPTQPTYATNRYGNGYYVWLNENGLPNNQATVNPLGILMQRMDKSTVYRSIGNVQLDYKMHFLPELRANLNLGYDVLKSDGNNSNPDNGVISWSYGNHPGEGRLTKYQQKKLNTILEFYLNYAKDLERIDSRLDALLGYSWQRFANWGYNRETTLDRNTVFSDTQFNTQFFLVSFFGRVNYTYKDRYLFTFTLRSDASSRFSKSHRWGWFPSAAFAWRISQEEFLRDSETLSDLKLRVSYGKTGQQDIVDNDYPYIPRFTSSQFNAEYPFGGIYYPMLRAEGYDPNIKWEETSTFNIGVDFGFLNSRITGSVDYYHRKTKDLINKIPVASGTNLTNYIVTNIGDLKNDGVELSLNATAIDTPDWRWDIGFNATWSRTRITKLTLTSDPNYIGVQTGGISGGQGNTIQIHSVGHSPNSFYVYPQKYGEDGRPLEGQYSGPLRAYKKPTPDVYLGINSQLFYKNWDFSFSGRAHFGNWVYNNVQSNGEAISRAYSNNITTNRLASASATGFREPQYLSDYYVQRASFFKMDNITLGYTFKEVLRTFTNLRLSFSIQQPFVISGYKGLDPEVNNGIDNNLYPRPRIFIFGLNVNF